jgi:hypothetical protein
LVLKIQRCEVPYIPKLWEVFKIAWVKYFAQFLFYYFVCYRFFYNFVVTGGVFETVEISEVKSLKE